jgi:hypothetical protein
MINNITQMFQKQKENEINNITKIKLSYRRQKYSALLTN